ncbi:MAG: Crp/Fnr family transcriptional regulator [Chloroflexi bacterium]|nr:Crp/Fnr family transcriptional regulator [Chloroflexota bacterium]
MRACKDKEQLVGILNAGEPLDLIPLLDSRPHSITARARGRVRLFFIPFPFAHDLIWNTPDLFSAVLAVVSMRLRDLATLATDLAFKDVTARVCKLLLEQAQTQGRDDRGGGQ